MRVETIGNSRAAIVQQTNLSPPSADPVGHVDFAGLWERVDGNVELLEELVGLFLDHSPRLLTQMEAALAQGDCRRAERAAHTLKGSLLNLCAITGAELALELEMAGQAEDRDRAQRILTVLHEECRRVRSELVAATRGAPV
jgi:HPt (histidine-containing phosphotransfer) domain-containing protein